MHVSNINDYVLIQNAKSKDINKTESQTLHLEANKITLEGEFLLIVYRKSFNSQLLTKLVIKLTSEWARFRLYKQIKT